LLERGKRERTANLDVFYAASPALHSRLGVVVPKVGNRIVDRNRLKRRLREIGRREVLPGLDARGAALDILIRVKRGAYGLDFERLKQEVTRAVEALCSRKR
jgi:ribonuclease P protein component